MALDRKESFGKDGLGILRLLGEPLDPFLLRQISTMWTVQSWQTGQGDIVLIRSLVLSLLDRKLGRWLTRSSKSTDGSSQVQRRN